MRLGRPLPPGEYTVLNASGQQVAKQVRYWAAEVVGGDGTLVHEIDEVVWLDVAAASARLTYNRDQDQLGAMAQADGAGTLTTWPLVILRHGKAISRKEWHRPDALRPLNARGRDQAEALVPILASYGAFRVVTSPSVRCIDTVRPYAAAAGQKVRRRAGLSEEGFTQQPDRASGLLTRLLERGEAALVCSHGPLLPVLLDRLADIADSGAPTSKAALTEAAQHGLGKGEALIAHVVGTDVQARVVDVERFAGR